MQWYKYLLILPLFIVPLPALASAQISEIYPSPSGGEDEWVEIYNSGSAELDTSRLLLMDAANKKLVFPSAVVPPGQFVIATSVNVLNNGGDTLTLMLDGSVIETVSYSTRLDATQSYARCGDNWLVTTEISRGRGNENACAQPANTPSPISDSASEQLKASPSTAPTHTPTPTNLPPTKGVPSPTPPPQGIRISEVFPYPDDGFEWIEIINQSASSVSLIGWMVDDAADSGSAGHRFNAEIPPGGYAVVTVPRAIWNNGDDSVTLLDGNSNIVDSFAYTKAKRGYSFGRNAGFSDICLQLPTPGGPNETCPQDAEANIGQEELVKGVVSSGNTTMPTETASKILKNIPEKPVAVRSQGKAVTSEVRKITFPTVQQRIRREPEPPPHDYTLRATPLLSKAAIASRALSLISFCGASLVFGRIIVTMRKRHEPYPLDFPW